MRALIDTNIFIHMHACIDRGIRKAVCPKDSTPVNNYEIVLEVEK
jgi:hypothetical protein